MAKLKLKLKIKLIHWLCRLFGQTMHMWGFPSYSVYTFRDYRWYVSNGDMFTKDEFEFYRKHYPFAKKVKLTPK
jgi:hypothetical protein